VTTILKTTKIFIFLQRFFFLTIFCLFSTCNKWIWVKPRQREYRK